MAAAGPLQNGVCCQDGASKMIKSIQYFAEAYQSRVLVDLDLKAAFKNVSRRHMLHSLGQHDPNLATVFSRWFTGSTSHRMHHDGPYAHIQASIGIDQGCPPSPCGFAAAVDPISRCILSETQRAFDSGAKLWAYLDDWYICIKPQHIPAAIDLASSATRTIHLELQPTKIQIWTASCTSPPPPHTHTHTRLPGQSQANTDVPGRTPPYRRRQRRQSRGARWTAFHEHRHATFLKHFGHPARTQPSGTQKCRQSMTCSPCTWVQPANTPCARRSSWELRPAVFDTEIVAYWSQLAGRDVTSPLFHLPLRMGGLGVGSAVQQHAAAPWTAWKTVIPTLMAATD